MLAGNDWFLWGGGGISASTRRHVSSSDAREQTKASFPQQVRSLPVLLAALAVPRHRKLAGYYATCHVTGAEVPLSRDAQSIFRFRITRGQTGMYKYKKYIKRGASSSACFFFF